MAEPSLPLFDCRFYVTKSGQLKPVLPRFTSPRRVVRFAAVRYADLIEPDFRQLLAKFEQLTA